MSPAPMTRNRARPTQRWRSDRNTPQSRSSSPRRPTEPSLLSDLPTPPETATPSPTSPEDSPSNQTPGMPQSNPPPPPTPTQSFRTLTTSALTHLTAINTLLASLDTTTPLMISVTMLDGVVFEHQADISTHLTSLLIDLTSFFYGLDADFTAWATEKTREAYVQANIDLSRAYREFGGFAPGHVRSAERVAGDLGSEDGRTELGRKVGAVEKALRALLDAVDGADGMEWRHLAGREM